MVSQVQGSVAISEITVYVYYDKYLCSSSNSTCDIWNI